MVAGGGRLRVAAFAIALWIGVEIVLFYAATRTIGVAATVLFMALKGLGGLALFALTLRAALRGLSRPGTRRGLSALSGPAVAAASAVLILIPGFLAPLAGVALFSPSVRAGALRLLRRGRKRGGSDGVLTLERNEWREVSVRRPRRSPRKTRSLAP